MFLPRSPKRRRSRSRSGSRKRKHRKRSRSRSRDRKRKSSRSYSSERRAREREKERQKKGLPPIRSKTLSGKRKSLFCSVKYFKFTTCKPFFSLMSKSPIIFSPSRYLVCSTTLWVGQVDKKATQQDLTNLFEEFGQIESINVSRPLPPLPSNFLAVCSFDLLTRNVMTVPQPVITVAVPNDLSCVFFKCLSYYPSFTRHTNLPVFSATLFCSL